MQRRKFVLASLATLPLLATSKINWLIYPGSEKGFKVNAGEARFGVHYKMKGVTQNILDIKISGKDTNKQLAVFEQNGLTPYGGPPLHLHLDQDEWFYVIDGQYEFQVGEERFYVGPGDTIFLPRNIAHAFIQLSDTAKVIVSYLPAGNMEAFFEATTKWTNPPSKEEIANVFASHGMEIVGPPLTQKK